MKKSLSPWARTVEQVLLAFNTSSKGLTEKEAKKRLVKNGPNALPEEQEEGVWSALKDAFTDPLALVLSGAAILSAVIGFINGEMQNINQAILIEGIVVFMALVGFYTDRQANRSLEKLKELQKTFARVIRNGRTTEIESRDLVVGDVIFLKEGDKVPADARIISAVRAEANEALLTGESIPYTKSTELVEEKTVLAHRRCMIYSGSYIESGNITAIVTATALDTEIGKIWTELNAAEETQTPLQQQLDVLGKALLWGTLIVCLAVILIFIWRGENILNALIVAVSLAIAFIPEALGAVITIALALGVREMVGKKAIIKKLRAAEGLGSVSVICTDKTGTITLGQMKVVGVYAFGVPNDLLTTMFCCNNQADASEKALMEYAQKSLKNKNNRIHEIPFSSERKMMSVVCKEGKQAVLYTKGAPERILERCVLTKREKNLILKRITEWEEKGYRVMGFAGKSLKEKWVESHLEENLTFIGLAALADPARAEVKETVKILKKAGIMPVMITGDSPVTALAIAKEVGILSQSASMEDVLTGSDLDRAFEWPEVTSRVIITRVFARTTPAHKIAIVRAYQQSGKLVAMSGDGVNDAPSIKQADVGIAMASGTEITKETADVILTGSYEAIASAVEIGRVILQRTRLYTHALLSTNGAEVLIFLVAAIAGWPVPLTAVQLLVINLLGDSWLSIALATEKPEKNIMQKPPRAASDSIITKYMYFSIGLQSVVTTIVLALGYLVASKFALANGYASVQTIMLQQSVIFAVFIVQKVLRSAFTARSLDFNLWQIGFFSNPWSLAAAALTIVLGLGALYIPFFGMMPVPSALWVTVLALGVIPAAVEEIVKPIKRILSHPVINVYLEAYGTYHNKA